VRPKRGRVRATTRRAQNLAGRPSIRGDSDRKANDWLYAWQRIGEFQLQSGMRLKEIAVAGGEVVACDSRTTERNSAIILRAECSCTRQGRVVGLPLEFGGAEFPCLQRTAAPRFGSSEGRESHFRRNISSASIKASNSDLPDKLLGDLAIGRIDGE